MLWLKKTQAPKKLGEFPFSASTMIHEYSFLSHIQFSMNVQNDFDFVWN